MKYSVKDRKAVELEEAVPPSAATYPITIYFYYFCSAQLMDTRLRARALPETARFSAR